MLRSNQLRKILPLCLFACAAGALAQNKPAEVPPKLDIIEQGSDVPVTITPPKAGGTKITEKKEGGRVTEVQVRSGKSHYTMKPNVPAGNAQPGDGQSSAVRAPQWTVLEFDLNKKKKTDREAVNEAASVPPPPPPPAATK